MLKRDCIQIRIRKCRELRREVPPFRHEIDWLIRLNKFKYENRINDTFTRNLNSYLTTIVVNKLTMTKQVVKNLSLHHVILVRQLHAKFRSRSSPDTFQKCKTRQDSFGNSFRFDLVFISNLPTPSLAVLLRANDKDKPS